MPRVTSHKTRIALLLVVAVYVWFSKTSSPWKRDASLAGQGDYVKDVLFSPDGTHVASGNSAGAVILWDARSCARIREFPEVSSEVRSLDFSTDGRLLACGSEDGTVTVWDVDDGRCVAQFQSLCRSPVWSVEFADEGRRLVVSYMDLSYTSVEIWDTAGWGHWRTLMGAVNPSVVQDRWLWVSVKEGLEVWDLQDGTPKNRWTGVENPKFSVRGRTLVYESLTGYIDVRNAENGEWLGRMVQWSLPKLSPDGTLFLLEDPYRIGNVETRKVVTRVYLQQDRRPLDDPRRDCDQINSAVWFPDGERLLLEESCSSPWICETRTGRCLARLKTFAMTGAAASFSPDGKAIAMPDGADVEIWREAWPDTSRVPREPSFLVLTVAVLLFCSSYALDVRRHVRMLRGLGLNGCRIVAKRWAKRLGCLTLVMLVLTLISLLPTISGPSRARMTCPSRLKQIGLALAMYSMDFNGYYPCTHSPEGDYYRDEMDGCAWTELGLLYPGFLRDFNCPTIHPNGTSETSDYAYRVGIKETDDPNLLIVTDDFDIDGKIHVNCPIPGLNHGMDGMNGLCRDGHVEWLASENPSSTGGAFNKKVSEARWFPMEIDGRWVSRLLD